MTKVIVRNAAQAIEIINSVKNESDLTVVIKDREVGQIVMKVEIDVEEVTDLIKELVKENTTTENSDVCQEYGSNKFTPRRDLIQSGVLLL